MSNSGRIPHQVQISSHNSVSAEALDPLRLVVGAHDANDFGSTQDVLGILNNDVSNCSVTYKLVPRLAGELSEKSIDSPCRTRYDDALPLLEVQDRHQAKVRGETRATEDPDVDCVRDAGNGAARERSQRGTGRLRG